MFRGLDGLCNEKGLSKPLKLDETLGKECADDVVHIITKAANSIRAIAKNSELINEETARKTLERVADQITNAKQVRKGFSKSIVALCESFGLPDSDIINAWYELNPRPDKQKKWEEVLSYYRGTIMHRGFLDFDEARKIRCGQRHFDEALGVSYGVVREVRELAQEPADQGRGAGRDWGDVG